MRYLGKKSPINWIEIPATGCISWRQFSRPSPSMPIASCRWHFLTPIRSKQPPREETVMMWMPLGNNYNANCMTSTRPIRRWILPFPTVGNKKKGKNNGFMRCRKRDLFFKQSHRVPSGRMLMEHVTSPYGIKSDRRGKWSYFPISPINCQLRCFPFLEILSISTSSFIKGPMDFGS